MTPPNQSQNSFNRKTLTHKNLADFYGARMPTPITSFACADHFSTGQHGAALPRFYRHPMPVPAYMSPPAQYLH